MLLTSQGKKYIIILEKNAERHSVRKMKRLISILLAIACVFALSSCGDGTNALAELVANANPSAIKTLTTVITADEVFHGTYLTTVEEDGFTFDYNYERYADVADAADSYIAVVEGRVYYKDGKYSEDGENWSVENPGVDYQSVTLNLDEENFTDYILSTDQTSLIATFTSDNSELVLGRKIAATGDITLIVKTNGVYLTTISISYTNELGEVRVDTSYSYSAASSDSGDAE